MLLIQIFVRVSFKCKVYIGICYGNGTYFWTIIVIVVCVAVVYGIEVPGILYVFGIDNRGGFVIYYLLQEFYTILETIINIYIKFAYAQYAIYIRNSICQEIRTNGIVHNIYLKS